MPARGAADPEGGENVLVIQAGGRLPDRVTVGRQAVGPTAGPDHLPRVAGRTTSVFLGGPGVEPAWAQAEEPPGARWELAARDASAARTGKGAQGIGRVHAESGGCGLFTTEPFIKH